MGAAAATVWSRGGDGVVGVWAREAYWHAAQMKGCREETELTRARLDGARIRGGIVWFQCVYVGRRPFFQTKFTPEQAPPLGSPSSAFLRHTVNGIRNALESNTFTTSVHSLLDRRIARHSF